MRITNKLKKNNLDHNVFPDLQNNAFCYFLIVNYAKLKNIDTISIMLLFHFNDKIGESQDGDFIRDGA